MKLSYFLLTLVSFFIMANLAIGQKLPTATPTPSTGKTCQCVFTFITPTGGMPTQWCNMPRWDCKTKVSIKWTSTGQTCPSTVQLSLVDMCRWQIYCPIVTSTPNNGLYHWGIPSTIPCGVYCVYIQNIGQPQCWNYSNCFIICCK